MALYNTGLSIIRTIQADELLAFSNTDKISYDTLAAEIVFDIFKNASVMSFEVDNAVLIQSVEFISDISRFLLKITVTCHTKLSTWVYKPLYILY